MSEQSFHLRYAIVGHPDGVPKEEVPVGWGACDAVLVAAIEYPPRGGPDTLVRFLGRDGRKPEERLPETEMFKVWTMLAHHLGREDGPLPADRRALCAEVFKIVTEQLSAPPRVVKV